MVKYLLLGLIIYGIYRFSNAPKIGTNTSEKDILDDEYTDYEEVE